MRLYRVLRRISPPPVGKAPLPPRALSQRSWSETQILSPLRDEDPEELGGSEAEGCLCREIFLLLSLSTCACPELVEGFIDDFIRLPFRGNVL